MKKYTIVLLFCLLATGTKATDYSNAIYGFVSFNQFGVGYGKSLSDIPLTAGIQVGLSNQDIDNGFNDLFGELSMQYSFIQLKRSQFYGKITGGFYFPGNEYYSLSIFTFGIQGGYSLSLGSAQKSYIFLEGGWLYGNKDYRLEYENEMIRAATVQNLQLKPLRLEMGYGFRF